MITRNATSRQGEDSHSLLALYRESIVLRRARSQLGAPTARCSRASPCSVMCEAIRRLLSDATRRAGVLPSAARVLLSTHLDRRGEPLAEVRPPRQPGVVLVELTRFRKHDPCEGRRPSCPNPDRHTRRSFASRRRARACGPNADRAVARIRAALRRPLQTGSRKRH
jgi:hypothetical protein